MNKQDKYDEDLLRKFMNPSRIAEASDGFTSKTMTRIQIEVQSGRARKGFFIRNRVPLISSVVIAALIVTAIIIPANETSTYGSTLWRYLQDLEFSLPLIRDAYFLDFNLPDWIKYAVILLFVLGFFDRALHRIFHREHN